MKMMMKTGRGISTFGHLGASLRLACTFQALDQEHLQGVYIGWRKPVDRAELRARNIFSKGLYMQCRMAASHPAQSCTLQPSSLRPHTMKGSSKPMLCSRGLCRPFVGSQRGISRKGELYRSNMSIVNCIPNESSSGYLAAALNKATGQHTSMSQAPGILRNKDSCSATAAGPELKLRLDIL